MSSFPPLAAAARQARTLDETTHRPWPLPEAPWSQAHTREDVLFAHWRASPSALARLLPPGLPLDTHDGEAWLGLVAYRISNLRLRGLPALNRAFPQLDVCTYVVVDDRPGIWLHSVETSNPMLAEAAKRIHRLPAYRAHVAARPAAGGTRFEAERDGLAFRALARPEGELFPASAGSLEHFLVERYCLYTADGGRLYRAELHHGPWQLRGAIAEFDELTLAPVALDGAPHLLHADAQDVLVWGLEEL